MNVVEKEQSPASRALRSEAMPEDPAFISASPAIQELRERIALIGRSPAAVMITGDSGTGKEVIARLIHAAGGDASRPFVAINCAAMPKDVIDNELFGHEREAFTGAVSKRSGCFELANGGTLFLDEIAEMHPQSQAKLLRAIETKAFRRLGGKDEIRVDVRVIAATNRDIAASIAAGELREDLYYRLSVVEFHLPRLRDRKEDIRLLAAHFLSVFADKYNGRPKSFSDEALARLLNYDWPGNVREFKNVVERAVLMCPDDVITSQAFPERFAGARDAGPVIHIPLGSTLDDAVGIILQRTLESTGQNKSLAAKILGISRKALYDKLGRIAPQKE